MSQSIRIVIFAKAPIPGLAKTRLIPALGADGAADLARRLLDHTMDQALSADMGEVELCVTPDPSHDAWQMIEIADSIFVTDQGEGDLGARMARAAERVIANGKSILLIGTDCPGLNSEYIKQAIQALHSADATLVPTFDGGYALIGLNRFHPSLFEGIRWSTDTVSFETLNRINQLNWNVSELPRLHDIDEPRDLKWLPVAFHA